jgi:hypothetical protein
VAGHTFDLNKKDIPGEVSLLPDNYREAMAVLAELSEVMEDSDEGLETRVWTSGGNGAPYGTEFIKVIASTLQFKEREEAFSELGSADSRMLTRGLAVKAKKEMRSEEMISCTNVE